MLFTLYNKQILIVFIQALLCLTRGTVRSQPHCSQASLNKAEILCKNVQHIKDLGGVGLKDWKQLSIVNEVIEVKELEWNDLTADFRGLEILDVSNVGQLVLDGNGFKSLINLKALNISGCNINYLEDTFFADSNKLKILDVSSNNLENISLKLKRKLQSLEVANFSHNSIQSIDTDGALINLKVLHLDFNELKSITLHDYENLNTLTLSENLIEKLTSNSFKLLRSMEDLTITNCPLNDIEDRTFESMTELKNLNLSANSLEKLSPDVFASLNRLLQLDLNSNNLKELAHLQFQHLVKLQYLDISHNSLTSLNSSNFYNLASLRKLFINENDIEEINSNTFSNLVSLDTLDLSYNGIQQLGADVFGSHTFPRLRKLLLKSNNLKYLNPLSFSSLPFLEYLSLGFNQLTTLDVRMFAPMRRLEKLHLGNNLIERISSDVLEALSDVKELLLDKNRLSFLSDSKATFENLEKVSLEGNPWQCPCWDEMTHWLDERRVSYVRPQSPYFTGQKPLCVVTPVEFCVKDIRLVREHKIEEIYNSG